jgi:hypothetical protein
MLRAGGLTTSKRETKGEMISRVLKKNQISKERKKNQG